MRSFTFMKQQLDGSQIMVGRVQYYAIILRMFVTSQRETFQSRTVVFL